MSDVSTTETKRVVYDDAITRAYVIATMVWGSWR